MKRAYEKVQIQLNNKVEKLLVDGNKKPNVNIPCEAVVKGDSKIHEIMAASILAKTARDRFMVCADKRWNVYGFAKHKGYPTKEHVEAIKKYGWCPIHRRTFNF